MQALCSSVYRQYSGTDSILSHHLCRRLYRLYRMSRYVTSTHPMQSAPPSPPNWVDQVSLLCTVEQCPTVHSRLCRTGKDMVYHAFACPAGSVPSPPDREGQGGLLCTLGQCPTVPSGLCRTGKDMASSHAFACPTNGPSPPDREGQVSILCQAGQCPTLPSRLCRTSKDMASSHAFACPTDSALRHRIGRVRTLLNTVVDTIFSRLGIAG